MSKKISDLTAATTPLAGTEVVEIVQSGASKKVAVSYLGGSSGGREVLSSGRTYYVRTDGNDSNNGLANNSGGAFLTVQKAVDVISGALDINIYNVTIQISDGTYTTAISLKPYVGSGMVTITGNATTPANVVISTTSNNAISLSSASSWTLSNFKIQTTTLGVGIDCSYGGKISISGINFGACASAHIRALWDGKVSITGNYTISGGSAAHFDIQGGGSVTMYGVTVTVSGTPAFSAAFVYAAAAGIYSGGSNTWSGSATGSRYNLSLNAVINTNGAGTSHFPGNSAGTTATGAQYA